MRRAVSCAAGTILIALGALPSPAAAQVSGPTQKLRVAVMDLSGSALRMQTTTAPPPGQPMQPAQYPPPEQTTDRHTMIDAAYGRSFSGTRVRLRASFDHFSADGTYPFAADQADAAALLAVA